MGILSTPALLMHIKKISLGVVVRAQVIELHFNYYDYIQTNYFSDLACTALLAYICVVPALKIDPIILVHEIPVHFCVITLSTGYSLFEEQK